jgi:hypothetical protein
MSSGYQELPLYATSCVHHEVLLRLSEDLRISKNSLTVSIGYWNYAHRFPGIIQQAMDAVQSAKVEIISRK